LLGGIQVQFVRDGIDMNGGKQAEEALQRSYQRLDLIAETASQLLASISPQQVVESICLKVMDFLDCDVFLNFLVADEQRGSCILTPAPASGRGGPSDRMAGVWGGRVRLRRPGRLPDCHRGYSQHR